MRDSDAYTKLNAKLSRINRIESIIELVSWDEQVNLPEGGVERRSDQMALLAELRHREVMESGLESLLSSLEAEGGAELSLDQWVVIREARRNYERIAKVPATFVARKAALDSRAYHAWKMAREKADYADFTPYLQQQLDMAREEAGYHGYSGSAAYDFHIDANDPGLNAAAIELLFTELRTQLVPLVREIVESPIKADPSPLVGLSVEGQRTFINEVTERIGFDYSRGRIDVSAHPFCSGDTADTRMTTRFIQSAPLEALFSSIHETGHGLYEQGQSVEHLGTGLGTAVGMAIHESQSRLWENQVARGRAFWRFFEPRFREIFGLGTDRIGSNQLFLAANEVKLRTIRTESDEVTYNLHIILRFELEKRLFDGGLEVSDLPDAWNALSVELMGLTPKNDGEGVLQDVHWSGGAFGYFPSYCLGNMIAAQLWNTINAEMPDLEREFEKGDFSSLLTWLREKIHYQGQRYDTMALIRRVTGETITPAPFLSYLRERYLPLYRA